MLNIGSIYNKMLVSDYLEQKRISLKQEIDIRMESLSVDLERLKSDLISKYQISPIVLKEPIQAEPKKVKEMVTHPVYGHQPKAYYRIDIEVPFEGEKDIFSIYPKSSQIVYLEPVPVISNNIIRFFIRLNVLDSNTFKTELNKYITKLTTNLHAILQEIEPWNNNLEATISEYMSRQQEFLQQKTTFMLEVGLKRSSNSSQLSIPSVIRKIIIPQPVSQETKNISRNQTPILSNKVYKDVINVIYQVGRAIERKPSLYLGKDECSIRDNILLFLETRYESTTGTSETFNRSGKTDILLKYAPDGSIIFVAECKFWNGEKKFYGAIDQLLNYVTHRDTKTALIIFVTQKNFQGIINNIKNCISSHPKFHQYLNDTFDTSFSYLFHHPDDEDSLIYIEVMAFHFIERK